MKLKNKERANTSRSLFNRNDSTYSSASTHKGGSLHIPGFGEGHNFKYDEDSTMGNSKFNGSVNVNEFSYKINMEDNSASVSQSRLDLS